MFDGTWNKTPATGWMFVPRTESHGGGPAATIKPLDAHFDRYEARFANLLGAGVRACRRGPRLDDTPRVRDAVRRWTDRFKARRAILESDLIHGRRRDGRDVDRLPHVNPALKTKALLAAYNPLPVAVERTLVVDLTYAGLVDRATVRRPDGATEAVSLDRRRRARVAVSIPPRGFAWAEFE